MGKKYCLKIFSVVLVVAMVLAMSVTAFATTNSYTTTVTYFLDGSASVTTSGTADLKKEVTHIVYSGAAPTEDTILYVDQDTADETDGSFSFDYVVSADKMKNVKTATTVVGTDGSAISNSASEPAASSGSVVGYDKLTVYVDESLTSVTVTAYKIGDETNIVTITPADPTNVVYVKDGSDVTFGVTGVSSFDYSTDGNSYHTIGAATKTVSISADLTVYFKAAAAEQPDFKSGWTGDDETDEIKYDTVLTNDLTIAPEVQDYSAPAGGSWGADGNVFEGKDMTDAKQFSTVSKINKTMIDSAVDAGLAAEYGILFTDNVDIIDANFVAGGDGVLELKALGCNSDGAWIINVVDTTGSLQSYKTRTYVKIGDVYKYGTIVMK